MNTEQVSSVRNRFFYDYPQLAQSETNYRVWSEVVHQKLQIFPDIAGKKFFIEREKE